MGLATAFVHMTYDDLLLTYDDTLVFYDGMPSPVYYARLLRATEAAPTAAQIAAAVWSAATRSLTASLDPSAASIVAAVMAALNATTIPVDTRKMNGANILGTGSPGDLWRGE